METPPNATSFRLLTDEEFKALTTQQRVDYLRHAIEQRNAINKQIDSSILREKN